MDAGAQIVRQVHHARVLSIKRHRGIGLHLPSLEGLLFSNSLSASSIDLMSPNPYLESLSIQSVAKDLDLSCLVKFSNLVSLDLVTRLGEGIFYLYEQEDARCSDLAVAAAASPAPGRVGRVGRGTDSGSCPKPPTPALAPHCSAQPGRTHSPPKLPEPIFRPRRYFFPTRSSILQGQAARVQAMGTERAGSATYGAG